MGGSFQGFDIVFLAIAAGFILYRLATVLGRRTGHEREHTNPYAEAPKPVAPRKGDDKVETPAPRTTPARSSEAAIDAVAAKGSPLARALTELQIADRHFNADEFLAGARAAYEMIVTAFAQGDRNSLKPLLSGDVYRDFERAITERESRGEHVEMTFVGLRGAQISEVQLNGSQAEVDVRFVSESITCTKNSDGAVIEGDPTSIHETRDLWTFARDVKSSDPNWALIATHTS